MKKSFKFFNPKFRMMKYQYFIIETKINPFPDNYHLNDELSFHTSFEIDGRSFLAFDFKQLKLEKEVKDLAFGHLKSNFNEKFQIIPIPKRNSRYRKCDVLYVTNIPEKINCPKQFMEKFCTGINKINKCFCYYTIKSCRDDLDRITHFLTSIPIENFHIMASFSCIDFPILRFSNLSLKTTEGALEAYINEHSSCKVVDIKMSKPCQGKNDKYANVLLQPDDNIEEAIKIFNFSSIDNNIIYVKQFLEPDMGREIKKYEITVVDLPKDMTQNTFLKEMSNFGRIFETIFDQESLIGYVVFIFHKSREKLLSSSKFHSYYSLVTILISNFPPNTTCDEVKTYVLNKLKPNKNIINSKENENITDDNDHNKEANNNNNDDDEHSSNSEDFEFDINSIKEIKVYQEQQYLSSDPTQLKSYFSLPTFSITLGNPFLVDIALAKLNTGLYKNTIAPYAIRYYPHSKDNDSERSQILKNLGDSNTIIISPIDSKVTLEYLFEICSRFGVILYFQINQRKVPIYCIVKYQTNESFKNALEDINDSTLNGQQIHTSVFSFEKRINDQSDKSEDSSSSHRSNQGNQNGPNSEDQYYDNPPPFPPWAVRPMPFPCDPRFMMRPFPMFPPHPHYQGPYPMCPPYPYQCFRGPPPEQQQLTQEQQREWEEFYRQWWQWWSCRRGPPHHCHKRQRDDRDQSPDEIDQKGENQERRCCSKHCRHFMHRRNREGEFECGKNFCGRKCRRNKDFKQNDFADDNEVATPENPAEMNQKSGKKCGKGRNQRELKNNEEEQEKESSQNNFEKRQGRQNRGPRCFRNRGYWYNNKNGNNEEEEDENKQKSNEPFNRNRGPHFRRGRFEGDEESNEKGDDSQWRKRRRGPHNWRGRRDWNFGYNEQDENQQKQDPNCFGCKGKCNQRNGEEEEDKNDSADSKAKTQNRRGPKCFRGRGGWTRNVETRQENGEEEDEVPYIECQMQWRGGRFGRRHGCPRGPWWGNRKSENFLKDQDDNENDSGQIETEPVNRRGRGGRGGRRRGGGRGGRWQASEPSQNEINEEVEIKEKSGKEEIGYADDNENEEEEEDIVVTDDDDDDVDENEKEDDFED